MMYKKVTWSANGIRMFDLVLYLGIVVILLCCFAAVIRMKCKGKPKRRGRGRNGTEGNQENTLQQEDIFNISSRVQGQETEWNTRDLTHVTISQHMHKPPYDDAPPSYEEAMRLAMAASLETSNGNNNSHSSSVQIQSVVVEEPKPVSSTSTSN